MAEIPKSLIVGGHEIIIRVGHKDELMDRVGIRGEFDFEKWTVDLKGQMNPTFQKQTLAHELIHAFFSAANIQGIEIEVEETICHGLENQFYRFLVDNDLTFFRNQGQDRTRTRAGWLSLPLKNSTYSFLFFLLI
jgi:hypothetical protein